MNPPNDIAQQDPLLATKLYIPRARPNLVTRPYLLARLNRGLADRKLTIISAAAGFGKTTLLSEWIGAVEGGSAAAFTWLSLDEGDNDPARFLSYLVAAIQTLAPDIGANALAALPEQATSMQHKSTWPQAVLTTLLNEITPATPRFSLVLDDYHVINTQRMHDLIAFLVERLPPQMHLVIASRTEPSLPLARLRVTGQLLELRTGDLRFTPDEAGTFLNQVMRLDLSADDIATLETRTEGWVAGLQLAALSMQNRQDISSFIDSFTGSHHYILDYLAEEVLYQQPETLQQFLLQTSILNRLNGPLCDAVLGLDTTEPASAAPSGQETLEHLEQANLFIIPLDDERHWYRYHHLFVDFLRNRLQQEITTEALGRLHLRAAEWYEQNGLAAEATGHALAMADVDRAARLIEQRGRSILNRSEMATLRSWLEALPEELVRAQPQLSLFHAWALVLTGQLDAVEARLLDAERLLETEGHLDIPGELTAIRATLAYFRRDLPEAIQLFHEALEKLPEENLFLRGAVAMSLATAYHMSSNFAGAIQAFTEASYIYEDNNIHMALIVLWNLAHLHEEQGELHQAMEDYQRALRQIRKEQTQGSAPRIAGRLFVGLANVFYQWNELEQAAEQVTEGLRLGQENRDPIAQISAYITQARIWQAQGQVDEAITVMQQAEAFGQQHNMSGWLVWIAAHQVRLLLNQANVADAARWAHRSELILKERIADDSAGYREDLQQINHLTQSRLLIARNAPDQALGLLAPLQEEAVSTNHTGLLIEIRLLQALAYAAQEKTSPALTALEEALLLAEPELYLRLFIDEVGSIVEMLRQVRRRGIAVSYVDKLLAALRVEKKAQVQPAELLDPLSDRELEILQLIGEGLSNRQISEQLFLTVGTVKWHINNIYSKLSVRRRTQALARAKALNLL